jgi:glycosyltransferase involved in cell wall biosynthesis
MDIRKKLKTAGRIIKERNWSAVGGKIRLRRRHKSEAKNYREWLSENRITETDREKMRAEIAGFPRKPLISILLPVYDIEEKFLRNCIESVVGQIYENWELCAADDFSPAPHVRKVLEEYARQDKRIKTVFRAANGHISAASNSALEIAGGEFTGLLDHDDELSEDALFYVVKEINDFPGAAFLYSDEDLIDAGGVRFLPKFKPDWSPDLFHSVNYVTHFAVYRTDLLRKIGGFRTGFEGSQDYDLALRLTERIDETQIRHIPKILYHWRVVEGSVAFSSDAKPYAHERAREALREHFARTGKKAKVERGIYELHRVRYELPAKPPRVSLLLSADAEFETAKKSAEKFFEETVYPNFEIVLICAGEPENRSLQENIKAVFRGNSSKAESLNRAVRESTGEILCFTDSSLRPLSKDWLTELTGFAIQKEIGAVGGKVLAPDETISQGGLILGFNDALRAANQGLPRETDEGLYRTRVAGNFSAVSAECLAVRREIFDKTGGFDAENFPVSLFDADLCLRLRGQNLRIVLTPYAELIETRNSGSETRSEAKETEIFQRKWRSAIGNDPFYNPNLSLTGETFTIKI